MIWALERTDIKDGVVHILYDSKYAAENIMGISHPNRNRKLVYMEGSVREKLLKKFPIKWTLLKGHQGVEGNERADKLAEMGRENWSMRSRAVEGYSGRAIFLMGSAQTF